MAVNLSAIAYSVGTGVLETGFFWDFCPGVGRPTKNPVSSPDHDCTDRLYTCRQYAIILKILKGDGARQNRRSRRGAFVSKAKLNPGDRESPRQKG